MAQYNITVDDGILKGLFTGERGMAQLLKQVLHQVLHAQAAEQLQVEPYERSEDRQGYRNGIRPSPDHPCRGADSACSPGCGMAG